jgi:hypothetical protein
MKHATAATLDRLEPLLGRIRGVAGLVERSRGVFYRRGRAALHFHDDPAGVFADVRIAGQAEFTRLEVSGPQGWAALLALLEAGQPPVDSSAAARLS